MLMLFFDTETAVHSVLLSNFTYMGQECTSIQDFREIKERY
jgi:hypothetical protein